MTSPSSSSPGTARSRPQKFSDLVHAIRDRAAERNLSIGDLLQVVGPKGHAFLTLFLVLPFLQPIPLPFVSTVFGITIGIVGFFMAFGKKPWIPKRIASRTLQSAALLKICSGLELLMLKLEHLIRPRGEHFLRFFGLQRTNGFLIGVHGLVLALPLPIPFSNFLPALVLFLIALGSLEEDLAVVALGYLAVIANAIFFTILVLIPYFSLRIIQS
jgi:hypothetical protein